MSRNAAHPEIEVQPDHGGTVGPPEHGGGGDGDGWRPGDHRGGRRLRRYRTALGFAVVSITTLFIALTVAYVYRRQAPYLDQATGRFVPRWSPTTLPSILWPNSLLLLISTFTVERARRNVFREPYATEEWLGYGRPLRRHTLPWLAATILLGMGFVAGQFVAWKQVYERAGVAAGDTSIFFFFAITGLHALHVAAGMFALLAAVAGIYCFPTLESRQITTDISAWYWHAMSALWTYLFVLLLVVR